MRFHCVYAQPEVAFSSVDIDAVLLGKTSAKDMVARIAAEPGSFGALKGATGFFASRADKSDRERAVQNVAPLADSISGYLRQRSQAQRRYYADEVAFRKRAALEIPALSTVARDVLERVRDAIDRHDDPAVLEYARADKMVKAELEGFAKAVSERFGERSFLSLAAKDTSGEAFHRVTDGMNAIQKYEVQQAWNTMLTVQRLSAHERTASALKPSKAVRQTKAQRTTLR